MLHSYFNKIHYYYSLLNKNLFLELFFLDHQTVVLLTILHPFYGFYSASNRYFPHLLRSKSRSAQSLHRGYLKNTFFSFQYNRYLGTKGRGQGAGLLSNIKWDAFDSVGSNLAPRPAVPEERQPQLGFLWWDTSTRFHPCVTVS